MSKIMLNSVEYTGGGGDSGMELTYDEYLALSEEKKTNGTTYYVKDINGAGKDQFQPIIYSEEEREIGVWTDGKPLYQKTIHTGALPSTTDWVSIPHGITNIDKVIKCTGIAISPSSSNDNYYYVIPQYRTTYNVGVTFEISETDINYTQTWLNNAIDSYVTLQYTKTTDQPGSGTWTPQGVPTVHYDGNEKVVGTWFGETLYEKTLLYQKANISSGSQNINHGITSFGKLVSLDAVWVYSNGDCNFATAVNVGDTNYLMKVWDFGTSDFTLHIGNSAYSIFDYVAFTIRYTKSTS